METIYAERVQGCEEKRFHLEQLGMVIMQGGKKAY
jgi:hypothetical protein